MSLPGYSLDAEYSAPWKELFRRERIDSPSLDRGLMPDTLIAIGRTVVARGCDAGDAFPELRALAWKRGADVLGNGVHVHESTTALCVVRSQNQRDAAALAAVPPHPKARTYAHGDYVFGVLVVNDACEEPRTYGRGQEAAKSSEDGPLENIKRRVEDWAGSRPISFELYFAEVTDAEFVQAKQALGEPAESDSRSVASYFGEDGKARAERLAQMYSEEAAAIRAACTVLVEGPKRPKRLAVLGLRSGASFVHQHGREAVVTAHFAPPEREGGRASRSPQRVVDRDALRRDLPTLLRTALASRTFSIQRIEESWGGRAVVELVTEAPALAMPALDAYAAQHRYKLFLCVEEYRPLRIALKRLIATCV